MCFNKNITNEVLALRTAAIGIGSNSLRMLIADISQGELKRLKRYRDGLRVFAALDEQGNILPEMIENACESVEAYRRQALSQGAEHIHLFATSAVRDAKNQDAFMSALHSRTGLLLEIISGEEEARLSYIGAAGEGGMIDIGGGSTEIVIGHARQIQTAVSLQMGAVRLFRMRPISSVADAYEVVNLAADILSPQKQCFSGIGGDNWVGVGGTFTTCAALVQRIPWDMREKIHGFVLTRIAVEEAMAYLAPMPLEERLALDCLQPHRADIAVHGIAILLACMQGLAISGITVSEYGNLEGFLKHIYIHLEKI